MPFIKGVSGNPLGRPKNCGEIAQLRQSVASMVPTILQKMAQLAINGDTTAAKLILERAVPPIKAIERPAKFEIPATGTLSDRANAVISAMADGIIAPGTGAQILSAIANAAKIQESEELAKRLDDLEIRIANPRSFD